MKNKSSLMVSLLAIFLGILIGVVIMIATGQNPIALFNALLRGATGIDLIRGTGVNLRYLGEFIVQSMPLILTGLSVAFAYRTGLFNIGAEGQFMAGSCAAISVAILFPMPAIIHMVACVLAGAVAGALWGFLPGFLKSKFHLHEVVICIMMNYIAMYTNNYIIVHLPGSTKTVTTTAPETASLSSDFLRSLTNNSRLNWGIIFLVIAIIAYWFIIEKTSFGYSLRATGFNKDGAQYAGMKVNRNIIYSMMIAGAMAGLAGAISVLGTFNYGRVFSAFENYGFDGIAVALTGACNVVGIVLSGFLFGLLKVSQPLLQIVGTPKEIGEIISASIVLFVAMQYGIKIVMNYFKSKKQEKQKPSQKVLKEGVKS